MPKLPKIKPQPKTLGSGYASEAARIAKERNKRIAELNAQLFPREKKVKRKGE